jgi:hypothetical protein
MKTTTQTNRPKTDPPLCECHGEPMRWNQAHKDRGYWRCIIRDHETSKKAYYRDPEKARTKAREKYYRRQEAAIATSRRYKETHVQECREQSRRYRETHFPLRVGGLHLGTYKLPEGMTKADLSATITEFKANQQDDYKEEVTNGWKH